MEYKFVWVLTLFIVAFLIFFAAFNLLTLFDVGDCYCTNCVETCLPKSEQISCKQNENITMCEDVRCKLLFGKCTEVPKYLDANYYIRSQN